MNHEYVEINTPVTNWTLTDPTLVKKSGSISGAEGLLKFSSTEPGVLSDNPSDPLELTPMQKQRSVTVWYSSESKFQITLGHEAEHASAWGRNMLFAGPGIYCPAVDYSTKSDYDTVLYSTDTNTQDSESHFPTSVLMVIGMGVFFVGVVAVAVAHKRKQAMDVVELDHLQAPERSHQSYKAVVVHEDIP